MEKAVFTLPLHSPGKPASNPRSVWFRRISLLIIFWYLVWKAILGSGSLYNCHSFNPPQSKGPVEWTKCDAAIECARIEVPLDYQNVSAGTASLSLARVPATHESGKIGTIFINPGGPGASGVNFVYRMGQNISRLMDDRYDVVGWDPRGVNGSWPRVECFTSQAEQDIFYAHTAQEGGISVGNLSDPLHLARFTADLQLEDARNEVLVQLCVNRTGIEFLKYVGTPSVARDLDFMSRVLEGEAPLNYWGFSYGTTIAAYFINMFPDRVGRIILDGVGNYHSWSHDHTFAWGRTWNFFDIEKNLDGFIKACSDVGAERCSLATNRSSASDIRRAIDKLLSDLHERPLPVPHAKRPGALTNGQLISLMFGRMYSPRTWPHLADLLSSAIAGDGAPILNIVQADFQLNTSIPPETTMANPAVICTDGPPYTEQERKNLLKYRLEEIMAAVAISPHFGAPASPDVCHFWPVRGVEYFTGPFNSTLSNDVLLISNTYDPISPIINGRLLHSHLKQSKLLQHDAYGHCTPAMASLCTSRIIREYFLTGTLPDKDEIFCPIDEKLFYPPGLQGDGHMWRGEEAEVALTAEDRRLLEIARGLGEYFEPFAVSHVGR